MGKKKYEELKPNQRINHLTLIEPIYKFDENRKRTYWKVKCRNCGETKIIREDSLKSRKIKACGCMSKSIYAKYMYNRRVYGTI